MMRSGNKTRNILNHFLVGVNKIICRVSVPGINEYIRSIDSGDEEGKMVEVLHQSDLTQQPINISCVNIPSTFGGWGQPFWTKSRKRALYDPFKGNHNEKQSYNDHKLEMLGAPTRCKFSMCRMSKIIQVGAPFDINFSDEGFTKDIPFGMDGEAFFIRRAKKIKVRVFENAPVITMLRKAESDD